MRGIVLKAATTTIRQKQTAPSRSRLVKPVLVKPVEDDGVRRGKLLRCVWVGLAGVMLVGCVERTITVTSEPSGALVYLNDEEVGRTPVEAPFTFYGTYDVRLERDGHEPVLTMRRAEAPVWDMLGPDLFAELAPNNKAAVKWHFQMKPVGQADPDGLLKRAGQMRVEAEGAK